jgi:[ribosomal protein S5]-alanine N-acetyltransferase
MKTIENVYGSFEKIETDRLLIRKLSKEDAHAIFHYASDPEVTKYVFFQTHQTLEDTWKFLEFSLEKYEKKEVAPWGIEWKETGELIGTCDFLWWSVEHKKAEIGYIISKEFWNRGIMSEAVKKLIQFGFEVMELNRIEARCNENNIASARVMEKVGMKFEGMMREALFIKGYYWNLKCYSILKRDWNI